MLSTVLSSERAVAAQSVYIAHNKNTSEPAMQASNAAKYQKCAIAVASGKRYGADSLRSWCDCQSQIARSFSTVWVVTSAPDIARAR